MNKPAKSLRDRKKEKTHRAILDAAFNLIARKGLDNTTMEDIANLAEISVPTIYSYFNTKEDIIFALFITDDSHTSNKLANIVKELPSDPVEAIITVQTAIITDGLDITKKEVWREISAAALRGPEERRSRYLQIQEKRVATLVRMLDRFEHAGLLDQKGRGAAIASNLYAISRNVFRKYLMTDDMTTEMLKEELGAGIRAALAGYAVSGRTAFPDKAI